MAFLSAAAPAIAAISSAVGAAGSLGTGITGIVQGEKQRKETKKAAGEQAFKQQQLLKEQKKALADQERLKALQTATTQKRQEQLKRAAAFQGRQGTILTGPSGLTAGGSTGKTLLGL